MFDFVVTIIDFVKLIVDKMILTINLGLKSIVGIKKNYKF